MLLSCGDALIDFMPLRAPDGREAYVPAVGGSCLNVAVAMARLGAPAGLVGGLSTDLFGRMIAAHAQASGVDLTHATRSGHQTTLAFVRFVDGEPHYGFYDAATAAQAWHYRPGAIPFERVACLHVGSTTLIGPVADDTLALVDAARAAGVAISFDPNCRPSLVADIAGYRARMQAFFRRADIVKLSDADFNYLQGDDDHAAFAAELLGSLS
jgi:fructokinase